MNKTGYQKVASVNGDLQGMAIQHQLELAGIPVRIVASKNGAYLDVLVPEQSLFDAHNLLNPERRSGEIFCVPSAA